ncbi:MAG: 3-dehydroquinate synthase [Planctomycetes bacterium]|nr:3-dehydroquinate synthase [Planctomycetota bacterium]
MKFEVESRAGAYPVRVERGGLCALAGRIAALGGSAPTGILLLSDENVEPLHGAAARRALGEFAGRTCAIRIAPGESSKTVATLEGVCRRMAAAGLDRRALLVALGGGVVSDLAGFAAAVYQRGIDWIAAPTSLLAQVDASIGGKTGVDLPEGKNLVGAFHAPRAVVIDPDLLTTLPAAEWRNGLAEVIKYGVLGAPDLFQRLAATDLERLRRDAELVNALVERCAALKGAICSADERDQGARLALNLGHTFGHALEAATGYAAFSHGAEVAAGLVAEADLAARLGLAEPSLAQEIAALCARYGLPARAPGVDAERVRSFLAADKKRVGAAIRFTLPLRLGAVQVVEVDRHEAIAAAVERLARA